MSASDPSGSLLVISAHAADFVWRAGGAHLRRSSGRNQGARSDAMGEAYQRVYPQVATELA